MKINNDIMIDLEFLSLQPDASVIQIAAIWFGDEVDSEKPNMYFNKHIDEINGSVDMDTLLFWTEQVVNGSNQFYDIKANGNPTVVVLFDFQQWLSDKQYDRIWCKGSLDFPILSTLYKKYHHGIPWDFQKEHELRTVLNITDSENRQGNHDALVDCEVQIKCLMEANRKLTEAGL